MKHNLTKQDYWDAIDLVTALCRERLGDQIISLVLHGSVASDRFCPNISDIDLFLLLGSKNGHIDPDCVFKILEIKGKVADRFQIPGHGELLNLWVFADYEIQNKNNLHPTFRTFDIIEMKRRSKELIGHNFLRGIPSLGEREISNSAFDFLIWCRYWRRRDSTRKDLPVFSIHHWTFRAAKAALALKNIFAGDKEEILELFLEEFKNVPDYTVLKDVYQLWKGKDHDNSAKITELNKRTIRLCEELVKWANNMLMRA